LITGINVKNSNNGHNRLLNNKRYKLYNNSSTNTKNNELDFTPLTNVVNNLTKYLQPYTLISSEVTIFPTGTEKLIITPIKEKQDSKLIKNY
jgi:hypothetical protein